MSNLQLELVIDAEIAQYTTLQTSVIWKGKLTQEEYLERDSKTGRSELCKQDPSNFLGLYVFVLKNLDLPNTDKFSQIVSSCETVNRLSYYVKDGKAKEIVSSCIGSVYCLPQHRRKGYSEKMIDALNNYWEKRLPTNSFMSLYSEVGDYYSRVGYKSYEVPVQKIKLLEKYQPEKIFRTTHEYLKYDQYGDLISKFNQDLQTSLIHQSQTESKAIYAALPTLSQFTWFHIRDIRTCSKIRKDIPDPNLNNFGVKFDQENFIIWSHEWSSNQLIFLKIQVTSLQNLIDLFLLATIHCKDMKLFEICFWETAIVDQYRSQFKDYLSSLNFVATRFDLENDSISAIRPFDKNIRNEFDYVWEQNEKWCWF